MSKDWFQKSIDTLSLNGKGERTQQAYTRALRMLVEFYAKEPAEITEAELEGYFLRRKNVDRWSANTLRICYCGIRFYFVHVLGRNWTLFNILRAKNESRLPTVLSREEVRRLLGCVHTVHNRAFLSTVYACGLRLQEALYLEVSDIDSDRMMVHVHRGKGAKDRLVPLPRRTLETLRAHWRTHRNRQLLFPALGRDGQAAGAARTPMAISSVQGALRRAKHQAGITKRGVSIHTLRHAYATHLLEAGVNLRVIQSHMGHSSLETTMVYLHLTRTGHEQAYALIDALMGDL
jgi:site-specific recombinase XerD